MSTKNVQTSTGTFDPSSMALFQSLSRSLGPALTGYINNPFGNPFFQTQQQMGTRTAAQQNQTNLSNITRNLNLSGIANNSPAGLEMMNNQMRAGTANTANLGFLNPVNNALSLQQNAMGLAGGYRPFQTGGTNTQTQSGLGSWLPQLASGLLGAAGGALTGGLLGGGGGGLTGTPGAWGAATSPMQSPFLASNFGSMGGGLQMGTGAPGIGGYDFGQNPFTPGYAAGSY